MLPDDILDAIGAIDDDVIKNATNAKRKPKNVFIIGTIAACLALFILIPNIPNFIGYESAEDNINLQSNEALEIARDYVQIYFVENGEIKSNSVYLYYTPDDIFNEWRKANGIEDEVMLLSARIESNGNTTYSEFAGEQVVKHEIGNYFISNIVISKNIENYYDTVDSELLLKSLERTMTEYLGIEFDEIHISLE